MKYSIYTEKPEGFCPAVEVAGCYCEHRDKILLLKRHPDKPQGLTWGVPAGKLEKGENPKVAMQRELYEEVGFEIEAIDLENIGKLYISFPNLDFVYHMFRKVFDAEPTIHLGLDEHLEARWVTLSEAHELPLIAAGSEALQHYSKFHLKKPFENN